MSQKIEHSGVVEQLGDGSIKVRIVQTSACAACKVAGYCHAAESKEKVIDVCQPAPEGLAVGDCVKVTASRQVASYALAWAFGLPFLVMVSVLLAVLLLTGSEGLAAVSGLLALVPYYGVLYLLRDPMRAKLSFSVEQID